IGVDTPQRLVNEAIRYRMRNGLGRNRNVAVARYRDALGQIQYEAAANTRGGAHAERNLLRELARRGIKIDQVEALYTQRSPCGARGKSLLARMGIGPEQVDLSFNQDAIGGRRMAIQHIPAEVRSVRQLLWSV